MKPTTYSQSFKPTLKQLSGHPLLTPILYVLLLLLLLLISFIIGSSFDLDSGIDVNFIRTAITKNLGIKKSVVTLVSGKNKNLIYFNEREVSWDELKQNLAKFRNSPLSQTLVIRVDRRILFEDVEKLMALVENANIDAIIAISPKQKQKETEFDADDNKN